MSEARYTKDHEWVLPLSDGTYKIGITDYAREALGDLVYLDLPKVGKKVAESADFAVVESVKAASEIYSPFAGEVVEVNDTLADDFGGLREDHTSGWIIVLKPDAEPDLSGLMDAQAYQDFLKTHG